MTLSQQTEGKLKRRPSWRVIGIAQVSWCNCGSVCGINTCAIDKSSFLKTHWVERLDLTV